MSIRRIKSAIDIYWAKSKVFRVLFAIARAQVNLLIYLLTKNCVRYYRTNRDGSKRYRRINDLKKLDDESLYNKLTFLRENRLEIISNVCDRYLRNSIAHMSFIVFSNGSVAYEGEKETVVLITKEELEIKKIAELISICQCLNLSLKKFYEQKYSIPF